MEGEGNGEPVRRAEEGVLQMTSTRPRGATLLGAALPRYPSPEALSHVGLPRPYTFILLKINITLQADVL